MPWSCINSKLSHNLSSLLSGFLFKRLFPIEIINSTQKRPSFADNYLHKTPSPTIVHKIRTSNALNSVVGEVTGNLSCLPAQKFDDHRAHTHSTGFPFSRKRRMNAHRRFRSAPGGPLLVYFIQSHKSRARPEIFIARGHSQSDLLGCRLPSPRTNKFGQQCARSRVCGCDYIFIIAANPSGIESFSPWAPIN
jgi:hypothetical protein